MVGSVKKKIEGYQLFFAHLLGWSLYAVYFYFTSLLTRPAVSFIEIVVFLLPFIATFYVSLFTLQVGWSKGPLWVVASFFIVFILLSLLGYIYLYLFLPSFQVILFTSRDLKPFFQDAIRGYVRFYSFGLLYFFLQKIITDQRTVRRLLHAKAIREIENLQLKQQELKAVEEKLQYEHAFLRAQINPHFLHNTLNSIYAQAMPLSRPLAEHILRLSSMMRYSMESTEFEMGKVLVHKELACLEALLDIYHLRFNNRQAIQLEIDGPVMDQLVPPLSFITIVENAFKYGDIQPTSSPLLIRISLKAGYVNFYCQNKINKSMATDSSTQIGIANLRKRLDFAFKDKYSIKITHDEENYTFELCVMN